MLNYKTLGGDILIFKGKNTVTIKRINSGTINVTLIEKNENENEITKNEIQYFIDNYEKIVGPNY